MIAPAYTTEWSQQCQWISPAQVEQDLALSRSLVEIYSDPILRERLLFRGGNALHKIVLRPAHKSSLSNDDFASAAVLSMVIFVRARRH
jgi:hypothetical protein